MRKVIERLKKKGRVIQEEPLHKVLDLDLSNPDDVLEYYKYKALFELNKYMDKKGISKADLARKLGVTRQAINDKFFGQSLSLDWLVKTYEVLGLPSYKILKKDKKLKLEMMCSSYNLI